MPPSPQEPLLALALPGLAFLALLPPLLLVLARPVSPIAVILLRLSRLRHWVELPLLVWSNCSQPPYKLPRKPPPI
jgi:hypothetical protein